MIWWKLNCGMLRMFRDGFSHEKEAAFWTWIRPHLCIKGAKIRRCTVSRRASCYLIQMQHPQWTSSNKDKLKFKVWKHYKFVNSKSLVEFCSGRLGDADAYYLLKNWWICVPCVSWWWIFLIISDKDAPNYLAAQLNALMHNDFLLDDISS